jgi:hypothetical protein
MAKKYPLYPHITPKAVCQCEQSHCHGEGQCPNKPTQWVETTYGKFLMCESCKKHLPAQYKNPPSNLVEPEHDFGKQIREAAGQADFSKFTGKRFPLGQLIMTRSISDVIAWNPRFSRFVLGSLKRHANADWGDVSENDKKANDDDLTTGGRLFSVYKLSVGTGVDAEKIWIITEANRSATTVLFPSDH